MFTYHCVYIVISLHCFFRASMFAYDFVYNVISLYVFFVFVCLHIILFTL